MIDGFRRIYLYHIQKTGGTSLNQALMSLGGERGEDVYSRIWKNGWTQSGDRVFVTKDLKMLREGNFFYGFGHTSEPKVEVPAGTFTLCCFRDSVSRVLSFYRELFVYRRDNVVHRCRRATDQWLGGSFAEFLELVPRSELLNQLYMFSMTGNETESFETMKRSCCFVFLLDSYEQAVRGLNLLLGLEIPVLHVRKSPREVLITQDEIVLLEKFVEPERVFMKRVRAFIGSDGYRLNHEAIEFMKEREVVNIGVTA